MFKSIRLKLTVWYSIALVLALATFGVAAYLYTRQALYENLDISLRNEAEWLRGNLESKLEGGRGKIRSPQNNFLPQLSKADTSSQEDQEESDEDYEIWNKIYEHSLLNSKKQFIYIFNRHGRAFYKSFNLGQDTLPSPPDLVPNKVSVCRTSLAGRAIRLASLNTRFYRIRVAYPEDDISEVLQNLFSIFLYLIPIVVMISVVGGYFLAKQSLKPVDEITRTARKITAAKLKERIQVVNSKDEIGRLAETLNDMIGRLEASFEEVTQFSMDASHELRTPLTIMRGEIELALRADQTTASYKETLASLLEEVVRMTSIIEGLILLAKADKGMEKIKRKRMRFDALVNEIKEDADALAEQKRIDISISKLDETTILGDEIRLRQLILNLITNAINYTREGGKVTLSLERNNGDAKFIVEDTGIGILKSDLDKIFDRFYRVDKSRSRLPENVGILSPLGLGLSISKWVAEAHGGRLSAESEVGVGSRFILILPAVVPAASKARRPHAENN
ncbi:MAG: sensor histidine kinase [Candidatus Kryptoniota bacterium]